MATLSLNDQLTPIELAKRFGDKSTIFIIEALSETNEMLLDAVIGEASDGTVNRTVQRATKPTGTRRIYGQPARQSANYILRGKRAFGSKSHFRKRPSCSRSGNSAKRIVST